MAPETLTPLRFFVFTCRDPRNDFRLPLVEALGRDFETWYIWLKRSPVVTGSRESDIPVQMSLFRLLAFMWKQKKDGKIPVYFNSTNALYPGVTALLRLISRRGVWCFDMHDDLLYHYKGVKRLREWIAIQILNFFSDVTVHAAATLSELFAKSQHLGNASQIRALDRSTPSNGKVLILASIDERFDFDLVSRVAQRCPEFTFDVYGQVLSFARARFDKLVEERRNIRYVGSYGIVDLPDILSRYTVTFAPYVTGIRQTRYIDPLRFYHCLNSGMEVITTDIPQARYLKHALHIVHGEEEFRAMFTGAGNLKLRKQPFYTPITWEQRADRLVQIVRRLPRIQRLGESALS
jgi:hypothetical protein